MCLAVDWCKLSLHITVFKYPYAWSNICTYMCVYIHGTSSKDWKSWCRHQDKWWWGEPCPISNVFLCHMAVAQLFIRELVLKGNFIKELLLITVSCFLDCVSGEIFENLTDLLILCTCVIGSQSRKETGMLIWKMQFSPLMGFYRLSLIFTVWGF